MSYLESLRVFVRVVELGSITAGGRDMRLSPAAASTRIRDLEAKFGARLLNRTTRTLTPTEIGQVLYENARRVLAALDEAEAAVASHSGTPQGALRVAAPLGAGRRLVGPLVPRFVAETPEVQVRLRLSDRAVNIVEDGIDMTRRDLQAVAKSKQRPWDLGKDVENSAVIGALTPAAAFQPGEQRITLHVNGEPRQDAPLSDMVWSIPELIADLSRYYHLQPGDLIYTGTPAGVGAVQPGDRLEARVEGLEPLDVAIGPAA